MRNTLKYGTSSLWILFTYLIPLLIFLKGLLLHRDVLLDSSYCSKDQFTECYFNNSNPSNCRELYNGYTHGQYCLPSEFKVIIVIIDALRYDFTDYQENLQNIPPYINKLPVIHNLLNSHGNNTRLFRFLADPPTTTTQRIKGVTAGNLPTFIDIGSNFFSGTVSENNIIDVLRREGKNVVFMGDDTWTKLYPNRFVREFPFESFNVQDLDSVDKGIEDNIFDEIRKPDWDLIIAHFLGVDHCGHTYGPDNSRMSKKLNEMNTVLTNIITEIKSQENVLLFVMGDHGMTATGNHGGESENEVNAALFVHSPNHPLYVDSTRINNYVQQIDLSATLSSILGVSISYSNIGRIVFDCLPEKLIQNAANSTLLMWQNIEQLNRYIIRYIKESHQFRNDEVIRNINRQYQILKEMWFDETTRFDSFHTKYQQYMDEALNMFRKEWIQFNMWYIVIGNTLMFLTLFLHVSILITFSLAELVELWSNNHTFISGIVFLNITLCLCYFTSLPENWLVIFAISIQSASVIKLFYLLAPIVDRKGVLFVDLFKILNSRVLLIITTTICSFVSLFSNSFIMEESTVCYFFLVSFIWSNLQIFNEKKQRRQVTLKHFAMSLCQQNSFKTCILINVCMKLGSYYVKCHDEKEMCTIDPLEKNIWKYSGVMMLICFSFIKFKSSKYVKRRYTVLANIKLLCLFALILHWSLEIFYYSLGNSSLPFNKIPAYIFIISFIIIVIALVGSSVTNNELQYFQLIFPIKINSHLNCTEVIIYIYTVIIFSIIAGIAGTPSILLMFVAILCLVSHIKYIQGLNSGTYTSGFGIIIWSISAIFWFYATGHNALFSSIEWDAAFIFQKEIGDNMTLPSILLLLSTFSSFIIHGSLLLYCHLPSKINNRMVVEPITFYSHSFSLTFQYITFFALRVFGVMLCCTIHARHLMVWKIFVPKLVFESFSFILTAISTIFFGFFFAKRLMIH